MAQGMRGYCISIAAIALSTAALAPARTAYSTNDALLGKACLVDGRYKEAVTYLERAVAADNSNSDFYDYLGRAYGRVAESSSFLTALGYARKAVHAFERAVELDPANLEAISDVFEYYLEAPAIAGGGLDKAEDAAKRFATLNPAEYHWASARLAEKRRDFRTAEREYRAALNTEPQQVGRLLDLASFLSSRARYLESDALFRAVDGTHPNTPKILYACAAAYVRGKRNLDEAEALLERFRTLPGTPEDPSRQEAEKLLKSARSARTTTRQGE